MFCNNYNKRIASSGASLPKGDRRSRGLREEPCRAWNSFGNNIEEYATTNETDFMGTVTMSSASGRQLLFLASGHQYIKDSKVEICRGDRSTVSTRGGSTINSK